MLVPDAAICANAPLRDFSSARCFKRARIVDDLAVERHARRQARFERLRDVREGSNRAARPPLRFP